MRTIGRPLPPKNYGDPAPLNQIRLPEGVAIGPDGNLYVADGDTPHTRVSVWTATGRFVTTFGDYGSGPGQLSDPRQLAVDGAGFVYVADSANNRIEKFTPDGQFAASIGQGQTFTTRPDLLSTPRGVAVAADGTIYATDEYLRRVQHYGADGTFLGSFGSLGSGDGQFSAPAGIAAGPDSLYVADWSASSVQRFSPAGAFAGRVGSGVGGGPGQFSHPFYVAVDCRGTLYVADVDNNRIQRLGEPGAAPCGDPAHDPAERLVVTATARTSQRFRTTFAVAVGVACDRLCTATVGGTVKSPGASARCASARRPSRSTGPRPSA